MYFYVLWRNKRTYGGTTEMFKAKYLLLSLRSASTTCKSSGGAAQAAATRLADPSAQKPGGAKIR